MADVSSVIRRYSLERKFFLLRKIKIKKEKKKHKREREIMLKKKSVNGWFKKNSSCPKLNIQ